MLRVDIAISVVWVTMENGKLVNGTELDLEGLPEY
jgi:hypothetical protein